MRGFLTLVIGTNNDESELEIWTLKDYYKSITKDGRRQFIRLFALHTTEKVVIGL